MVVGWILSESCFPCIVKILPVGRMYAYLLFFFFFDMNAVLKEDGNSFS